MILEPEILHALHTKSVKKTMASSSCGFPGCKHGSDAVRPCFMMGCAAVLHHFCFEAWRDANEVPELPGNAALCPDCAEEVCLQFVSGAPCSEESIKALIDKETLRKNQSAACNLDAASEDFSEPASWSEDGSAMACGMSAAPLVPLLVDKTRVDCPLCGESVLQAFFHMHAAGCNRVVATFAVQALPPYRVQVRFRVRTASDAADGDGDADASHDDATGATTDVRATLALRANSDTALAAVKAAAVVGTRCCIRGMHGFVWDQRKCADGEASFLAVIYDSFHKTQWDSFSLAEYEQLATVPSSATRSDIDQVFVRKHVGNASAPSAVLKGALGKASDFYAFSHYEPLPPFEWHAEPLVAFPLEPGVLINCQQPCVSAQNGANKCVPSSEIGLVDFCGILVAENSFKLDKKPYSRWVVCLHGERAVIFPFASVVSLADASERESHPLRGREVCASTLATVHQQGRKPDALESVYKAALHQLSTSAEGVGAGVAASPSSSRSSDSTSVAARLKRTRSGSQPPSTMPTPPEPRKTARNTGKSPLTPPAPRLTRSGIPLRIANFGPSKLDACTLEQLCESLKENGLEQPPAQIADKAGWAKNALMMRSKLSLHSCPQSAH